MTAKDTVRGHRLLLKISAIKTVYSHEYNNLLNIFSNDPKLLKKSADKYVEES